MQLIFEKSMAGRSLSLLPKCDVEVVALDDSMKQECA